MAPPASPSAPRCSLRRPGMGDAAVEDEDAVEDEEPVEDEDAGNS